MLLTWCAIELCRVGQYTSAAFDELGWVGSKLGSMGELDCVGCKLSWSPGFTEFECSSSSDVRERPRAPRRDEPDGPTLGQI
jgi:hypothetical protein